MTSIDAPGVRSGDLDSSVATRASKSANLADLTDAAVARTSLGLGAAATQSVGTSSGTVAAGDDSRITGASQKAANLSDLASAATARTNLGLGTAATSASTAFETAGAAATAQSAAIASSAQRASNLSDLANAATARTNLGLGSAATMTPTALAADSAFTGPYAGKAGTTFSGSVLFAGRRPWIDPLALGAIADGTSHPLSGVYGSLAAAQAVYPHATGLTQELDWAALQLALNTFPSGSAVDGGIVAIYGDYYLGADGLTSTRPNIWMLGLAPPSHGAGGSATARITGNGSGQVLLSIGSASVTNHRGWRFDNITFRDVSASNDQIAGAVQFKRFNFNRFFNCDFQSIKSGFAVQLDGTGDSCQYSEFVSCRARQVLHGIQVIGNADDTVIHGGSWAGTAAATGIGIQVVSSMRLLGANVQGFETGVEVSGNTPCVTDLRGDLSGGAVAQYVRVRSTAVDARINNPMFGGTAPSVAHILVDSGATRTRIHTPTTNTAAIGVSDSGTDTRISGLAGALAVATSQTALANSTTETVLGTYTIQSASARVGTVYGYRVTGQSDNIITSGALTFRFRLGGISGVTVSQVILPSGASATTNRGFVVTGRVVFRTVGGSATWASSAMGWGGPGTSVSTVPNSNTSGSTVNSNTALDAVVTAQWATADPGNALRVEMMEIELVRA